MGNERLRHAMRVAGVDIDDLAAVAEVDVKTVRRWLGGGNPYARHRIRIARALATTEDDLWPELAVAPTTSRPQPRDFVDAYPSFSDPRIPEWEPLLNAAAERIELLDFTLLHLLARPGITDLLQARAAAGCHVRILICHDASLSDYAEDLLRDEPDADGNRQLHLDNARARGYLHRLLGDSRIELREFAAPRYNSIIRADHHMLVTLHLWGMPTTQAPTLHIHRQADDEVFDCYARHFDTCWQDLAQPLECDPQEWPDPDRHPDRYEPVTEEQLTADSDPRTAPASSMPLPAHPPPPALQRQRWPRRPSN